MNVEFVMTNDEGITMTSMTKKSTFGIQSLKHSARIRAWSCAIALLFVLASTSNLFACAACAGGKTDSELAQGMNAGIFTLMGVVVFVLAGAASFAFYLVRRASRVSQLAGNEPVAQPTI